MSDGKQYSLTVVMSALDRISAPLKGMGKNMKVLERQFERLGRAGHTIGTNLGLPMAALGGAGFVAIGESMKKFMDLSEQVEQSSKKAGMSMGQWQEWSYVAKQNGVDTDDLYNSFKNLNLVIGEAAHGKNPEALALFNRLGISLTDANKQIVSGVDIMPRLSDAFEKNTNAVTRSMMATTLMKKAGDGMITTMSKGYGTLAQQMKQARDMNLEFSDEEIKSGEESHKSWLKITGQLDHLYLTLGSKLLPVMGPLVDRFSKWLTENNGRIMDQMATFAKAFADAISNVKWQQIGNGLLTIMNAMNKIASLAGGWDKVMIGLFALSQVSTVAAIFKAGSAIWAMGGSLVNLSKMLTVANFQLATMSLNATTGIAKLGALGGAFAAGYAIGDFVVNPLINDQISKKMGHEETLGGWLYDKFHDPVHTNLELSARKSVLTGGRQQVSGEIKVSFNNAPPGTRVSEGKASPGFALNPSVGYRSAAYGGSW